MKWYKFVIYFQLFAAVVMAVGSGVMFFQGTHYNTDGINASMVYSLYSELKILDVIVGFSQFCIAGFAIYTRQMLRYFKRQGPSLYLAFMILNAIITFVYLLMVSVITGMALFNLSMLLILLSYVVVIVLNCVYFGKRRSLFIN